ncbi:hypothetical protein AMELA_G00245580 [Ameiurus melas]|uniref:Uncharacterized protein n=1 Tax=Ameiurus melas TaxID=219545 RepID=A0A7J5ZSJ4_AMEME|nr:hypothetical protein AMELA_G00245580 [Ameiurus melas]
MGVVFLATSERLEVRLDSPLRLHAHHPWRREAALLEGHLVISELNSIRIKCNHGRTSFLSEHPGCRRTTYDPFVPFQYSSKLTALRKVCDGNHQDPIKLTGSAFYAHGPAVPPRSSAPQRSS